MRRRRRKRKKMAKDLKESESNIKRRWAALADRTPPPAGVAGRGYGWKSFIDF